MSLEDGGIRPGAGPAEWGELPFGRVDVGVDPGAVLRALLAVIALLAAAHVAAVSLRDLHGYESVYGFVPLFDLDQEGNLPTWFSAMLLTASAVLLFGIQRVKRSRGDRFAAYWTGLAVIFAYLSVDEAAGLHELSDRPLAALNEPIDGLNQAILFGIAAVVVALLYLRFFMALPRRLQVLFVLAGVLLGGGAIGGDLVRRNYLWPMIEGALVDTTVEMQASHGFTDALLAGGEEVLEMLGAAVFLYALLTRLGETPLAFTLRAVDVHRRRVAPSALPEPGTSARTTPEPAGISASPCPRSGTTRAAVP